MAVDTIADRHGFTHYRARFHGVVAEGFLAGDKVLLLKPLTYMNESGRAVAAAVRFYKLPPEQVTVVHDEIDLRAGKVRVKRGGGPAGHNGLRSVDAHIGRDYRRVRLGVGHPGDRDKVTRHVLRDFAKADESWLGPILDAVADAAPILVAGDDAGFMTRVALLTAPPKPPSKPRPAAEPVTGAAEPPPSEDSAQREDID